jgi:hypothetical protein
LSEHRVEYPVQGIVDRIQSLIPRAVRIQVLTLELILGIVIIQRGERRKGARIQS